MSDRGHADPVAQKEIDRLRAGEDRTPVNELEYPTPGQRWHRLLEAEEEERLRILSIMDGWARQGSRCVQVDHARMEERNADLRSRLATTEAILDRWERSLRGAITDISEVVKAFAALTPDAQARVIQTEPPADNSGWQMIDIHDDTVTNKENPS